MTTYSTGYSPTPKNYDEFQAIRDTDIGFGRRHTDPDLLAPYGTVKTGAQGSTDKLWTGTNGTGDRRATPRDNDSFKFPTVEDTEDWRHQALPRTTIQGGAGSTETGWYSHDATGPTFVTKPPTDKIPAGAANSVAMKYDSGKTDWSLMPFEAIEEINKVLDFGAKKYAAHNWRTGSGFKYTRVLSSLLRHTFAWARGEDLDPESGLSHLAHMGCNVVFLIYYNKYKTQYNNDDRVTS